jgi:serine/threonine-protein kinase RsbW
MVTLVSFRDERSAHRNCEDHAGDDQRGDVGWMPFGVRRPAIVDTADDTADLVQLRVPADPAYLAVVRTATAGLAARLDLTLDEIEDLRIAVDEACSLLLVGRAHPGHTLSASFGVGQGVLTVTISGPAGTVPEEASFSWTVLRALAGEVVTGIDDGEAWIRLTHLSGDQP